MKYQYIRPETSSQRVRRATTKSVVGVLSRVDINNIDPAFHPAETVAMRLNDPSEIAEHTKGLSKAEYNQVRTFMDDVLAEVGESFGRRFV